MKQRDSFVCLMTRVRGTTVLNISLNRNECFKSGFTNDLCDWFLLCNDYFIQISNGTANSFYQSKLFSTPPMQIHL